jgi:ADP-dependent NAD(P)H-hydrate dehydratase / NAD(P)H-hydrate epimerase
MPGEPLVSVEQIRAIECGFAKAHPDISLMQRAGEATARFAETLLGRDGGRVLVLAGSGNNGGDAWVAARALQQSWHRVTVYCEAPGKASTAEAQAARDSFIKDGGKTVTSWPEDETHDLIIDGLLGIGLAREVKGDMAALIARANASGICILAIDIPSGLDADSGVAFGATIRAQHTLTFIGAKSGLFTADGRDHTGEVRVETLGIDAGLLDSQNSLLTQDAVRTLVPRRNHNSHKGQFGSVGVVGGSQGMTGAALLAARAALHLGAGKVLLAMLSDDAPALDLLHPEIMMRKARDLLAKEVLSVLVIGPGMGVNDMAKNIVAEALKTALPLVIDADALNLIADGRALQNQLVRRAGTSLLTPHPGEAARLLQCSTHEVQAHRVKAACALAGRFKSMVVLKGCGSVVAFPDGAWHVNASGNSGMASGGMGDALSGMLGALLAQGVAPPDALMLGVCLHGAAADLAVEQHCGPAGLTASEVIFSAREVLNEWAAPAEQWHDAH